MQLRQDHRQSQNSKLQSYELLLTFKERWISYIKHIYELSSEAPLNMATKHAAAPPDGLLTVEEVQPCRLFDMTASCRSAFIAIVAIADVKSLDVSSFLFEYILDCFFAMRA